jgi:tRNA pseudouridine38-40 synthase
MSHLSCVQPASDAAGEAGIGATRTLGRISDVDEAEKRRVRLDIAYDGTDFAGWARQPTLRTVQGAIEDALAIVFRRFGAPPTLVVAGRTDAGVHATGQVAHLDLTSDQVARLAPAGPAALSRRLNGILGTRSDVTITRSSLAPAGFDARFSAVWRRYEYRIGDAGVARNPLWRNHVLTVPNALDLDRMNAAARELIGLHDFAAYCRPREGATTIRTLQEFEWTRRPMGFLLANVRADAFCHSMVRSLVGACIAVGSERLEPDAVPRILEARQRTSEFIVAPALGLVLAEVGYPDDAGLGARAEQTRARREAIPLADPASDRLT